MSPFGRVATLALAIGVAFALTACGGSPASSSTASSDASASTSASSTESSATETSASEATDDAAGNVSTYENEYFGINIALPAGWKFLDDEPTSAEEQAAQIASGSSFDMRAISADEASSAVVVVEEPNEANAGLTAEEHLAALVKEMEESAAGASVTTVTEDATLSWDGSDRTMPAAIVTLTQDGAETHNAIVITEKEGNFLCLLAQGPTEDAVNEILGGIKLILE